MEEQQNALRTARRHPAQHRFLDRQPVPERGTLLGHPGEKLGPGHAARARADEGHDPLPGWNGREGPIGDEGAPAPATHDEAARHQLVQRPHRRGRGHPVALDDLALSGERLIGRELR
jgi:hypothetical protein